MARWTVSDQAERTLDAWLDGLQRGQIRFLDLPPSVAAFIHAGEAYGRAAGQPEIDRLNHQLDAYWARAFLTHDERRERILQHLDRGLQEADETTWERIEHELAQANAQRSAEATNVAAEEQQIDPARRTGTQPLSHSSKRYPKRAT